MEDYFEITPEEAKEITGFSFTTEDLKSKKLAFVIRLLRIKISEVKIMASTIEILEKQILINEPKATCEKQLQNINKKSNPERSRPFLRVVS